MSLGPGWRWLPPGLYRTTDSCSLPSVMSDTISLVSVSKTSHLEGKEVENRCEDTCPEQGGKSESLRDTKRKAMIQTGRLSLHLYAGKWKGAKGR